MKKASYLIRMMSEIGIKGGDIEGFEQKIKKLQVKYKSTYPGDTLDSNIDNFMESPDQIGSLLAFRAVLATGIQKLRDEKQIKDTQNMIVDIDKVLPKDDSASD